MTPYFVRSFKKEHKCLHCTAKKQTAKSLCPNHLRIAREAFARWSVQRRDLGRCICCEGKSLNGWLRCRRHTKINRDRCKAWMKVHYAEKRAEDVKKTLETGLCQRCVAHNPIKPGTLKCQPCLNKHRFQKLAQNAMYQALGRCVKCKEHRKTDGIRQQCSVCRVEAKKRRDAHASLQTPNNLIST